ncbi:hypothetical protein SAMN05660776_2501 [Salegentibacter holothuriorum]|uniref:Uncharacterized protein n=1 Tax=Salegentibacter holothuriorum TaxID=241145 RepID=A0A1T5D7N1_9FLAO|nr:hypothetical protein [Salegentibacter holothuriorum]SKB67762.1 hypothetical protein SAMN05660776_2501 [Salegentibacter holothuriorum]
MTKKEDIKKLEKNWESLNQEDKEREKNEFRDLKQKEADKKNDSKDKKAKEKSETSEKASAQEEREFMDQTQKEKTNKKK